jgi:hypothetical protein
MKEEKMNIVTATFKDRASSEIALRNLEGIGIKGDQVSLVMTDETRHNHFKIDEDTKADEGAISGAALGGIAGALLSTLTTAGVMTIPGLSLVVAGPFVAALAGLGVGAITGGVIGGLVGAGIPEHEAKIYEKEIKNGGVLLAVEASDGKQKKQIKEALETADAYNIAA